MRWEEPLVSYADFREPFLGSPEEVNSTSASRGRQYLAVGWAEILCSWGSHCQHKVDLCGVERTRGHHLPTEHCGQAGEGEDAPEGRAMVVFLETQGLPS